MKTAPNAIREQYFTEQELAQFISDFNVSDFKFHVNTYCSYKGLATLPITAEQSDEHLFLLKSQDKEAEKALIQILISFFTALSDSMPKPVSIKLSDSISIPVNPKLSNSIWISENPTFAEAIAIFEKPKFRKQLQKLIMEAQNNHLDNGIYSSRAFSSFKNLLLAFDRNECLKLGHNTLDIQLIGSDSWVADIIHLYKESSDLFKTVRIDGVIKLLETNSPPKTGDRVLIESESNTEMEGTTVFLQSDLSNIEYLYLKMECENIANILEIDTYSGILCHSDHILNTNITIHKTKLNHINTIKTLCRSALREGLSDQVSTDAIKIISKAARQGIVFPVKSDALVRYLKNQRLTKKLGPESKNSFNTTIKALALIVTKSDPNTHNQTILDRLKHKDIPMPVSDTLILGYLEDALEIEFN